MQSYRFLPTVCVLTLVLGIVGLAACHQKPESLSTGSHKSTVSSVNKRANSQVDSPFVYIPKKYSEADIERLRQIKKRLDVADKFERYKDRKELINGIVVTYRGAQTEEQFQRQRAEARKQIKEQKLTTKNTPRGIVIGEIEKGLLVDDISGEDQLRARSFAVVGIEGVLSLDSMIAAGDAREARSRAAEAESLKIKKL